MSRLGRRFAVRWFVVVCLGIAVAGPVNVLAGRRPQDAQPTRTTPPAQLAGEAIKPTSVTVVDFADAAAEFERRKSAKPPLQPFIKIWHADAPREPEIPAEAPAAPAPMGAVNPLAGSPVPLQNYEGLPDITSGGGFLFIPPDTRGAIGTDAINRTFVNLNNAYRVQNKTTGATVSTTDMEVFWAPTGATGLFDPRVVFDPYNNRWILAAVSNAQTAASSILVGISNTSDPAGTYTLFTFDADPGPTGPNNEWADYPMIGFNTDKVAISVNMFTFAGAFTEGRLLVLDYPLLRGMVPAASATYFHSGAAVPSGIPSANGGFCMHPVFTYSSTEPTLYFVSHMSSAGATYRLTRLTGTQPVALTLTIGAVTVRPGGAWVNLGGNLLPQAPEPAGGIGGTAELEAQDAQIRCMPVFRNGSVYYAQSVGLPAGAATRSAVQWTQLNATTGAVVQGGRIEDPTATFTNGLPNYAFGSIAVNAADDILVGFSRFESDSFVSAAYAYHDHTDAAGSMRTPYNYKLGEDYYECDFATGASRNRWGDYSSTVVDPTDDMTMWTLQEYAETNIYGNTDIMNGTWGTWWARVLASATAAEFDSFSARAYDGGQLLQWRTAHEVDAIGFNVYREDEGTTTRLNPRLIAGSALMVASGVHVRAGRTYTWWDPIPSSATTRYIVEEIDLSGAGNRFGPFGVDAAKGPAPKFERAAMFGDARTAGVTRPVDRTELVPVDNRPPAGSGATAPGLKVLVDHEGWYRIDASALGSSSLANIDPRTVRLLSDGREIPMRFVGEADGTIGPGDSIEFYAIGTDSPFTSTRTYLLVGGATRVRRIGLSGGTGTPLADASFPYAVESRERFIYFSSLRNGETENFFGDVVSSAPFDQRVTVTNLADAGGTATVDVSLQGVIKASHQVEVRLNDRLLGTVSFADQDHATASYSVPASSLVEGANAVRFTAVGGPADISLVDTVRITYPHAFRADGDALRFEVPAGRRVTVDGFSSAAVRVLDVTNPANPTELATTVSASGGSFAASAFATGSGQRVLYAFAASQAAAPAGIRVDRPSTLKDRSRRADLVIITDRTLAASFDPLVALRRSQGLAVEVVDVEDVYDEFSFGQKHPGSIRAFLDYARTSWSTRPRFVILAGEASYDPKDYFGVGASDLVPTRLVDTNLMEAASDDWFADFNDDGIPELAVGRLPIRTASEAAGLVSKIVRYETSRPSNAVTLVADISDTSAFASANAALVPLVPSGYALTEIERGQQDPATTKQRLIDAFNSGQTLLSYSGHGSVDLWRGLLLTGEDASLLTNDDQLAVVVAMTCLNGYFFEPQLECLGESLLEAKGGAAAVWASSGMTLPEDQFRLNTAFFNLVFNANAPPITLGQAAARAKSSVTDVDVRRTWILFGDPSMRMR
jgi:hypothetical protein